MMRQNKVNKKIGEYMTLKIRQNEFGFPFLDRHMDGHTHAHTHTHTHTHTHMHIYLCTHTTLTPRVSFREGGSACTVNKNFYYWFTVLEKSTISRHSH